MNAKYLLVFGLMTSWRRQVQPPWWFHPRPCRRAWTPLWILKLEQARKSPLVRQISAEISRFMYLLPGLPTVHTPTKIKKRHINYSNNNIRFEIGRSRKDLVLLLRAACRLLLAQFLRNFRKLLLAKFLLSQFQVHFIFIATVRRFKTTFIV